MATLASLPDGALVKFGTIYGNPIIWRVIGQDHYATGQTSFVTDRIIKYMCVDGMESSNSDSNRKNYGNNRYIKSNLHQWLNSDALGGTWYSAQHSADAPPSSANTWSNHNAYDEFPGFLNGFTTDEKSAICETSLTCTRAAVDNPGTDSFTAKVFLLSCTEVGLSGGQVCGTQFPMFNSNSARLAYGTAEAVANSDYSAAYISTTEAGYWWLRDAQDSVSYRVQRVSISGTLGASDAHYVDLGARPALNLSSSISLSSNTDADGCYTLVFNKPPEAPANITVPSTVATDGTAAAISWDAANDPNGDELTYRLQRRVNSSAWETVYEGSELSYSDTGVPYGATTAAWRVCSIDPHGLESPYTESAAAAVVNEHHPMSTANFAAWLLAVDGDGGAY